MLQRLFPHKFDMGNLFMEFILGRTTYTFKDVKNFFEKVVKKDASVAFIGVEKGFKSQCKEISLHL